jgi:hypothetical protein
LNPRPQQCQMLVEELVQLPPVPQLTILGFLRQLLRIEEDWHKYWIQPNVWSFLQPQSLTSI